MRAAARPRRVGGARAQDPSGRDAAPIGPVLVHRSHGVKTRRGAKMIDHDGEAPSSRSARRPGNVAWQALMNDRTGHLTELQLATLRAVCDTIVPSIRVPDDPTGFWARSASDMGVPAA